MNNVFKTNIAGLFCACALLLVVAAPAKDLSTELPTPETIAVSLKEAYSGLEAYEDRIVQTFSVSLREEEGGELVEEKDSIETSLRVRGEDFALINEDFEFHKIDKKLVGVGHLGSIYFTLEPYRFDLTPLVPGQFGDGLMVEEHPILSFFTDGAPAFDLTAENFDVEAHGPDEEASDEGDGEIATRGKFYPVPEAKEYFVQLTLNQDAETKRLRSLEIDSTEMLKMALKAQGETTKLEKRTVGFLFNYVKVNDEVSSEPLTIPAKPEDYQEFDLLDDPEIAQKAMIGGEAPHFAGTLLNGDEFDLADLKGQVVLLDFWASWCQPCIVAMPMLHEIADDFKDEPVTVLGVNIDQPNAKAMIDRAIKQHNITLPQLWDKTGEISAAYKIQPIPCTIVLDPEGKVAFINTGVSRDTDITKNELTTQIKSVLGKAGDAGK